MADNVNEENLDRKINEGHFYSGPPKDFKKDEIEEIIAKDIHRIVHDRPVKIELEKTAKSGYRYSVAYYGEDPEECLRTIEDVMKQLETLYGPEGTRVKNPLGD